MQTMGNGRKFHSFLMCSILSTFSYFETNNSLKLQFQLLLLLARLNSEITPLNKQNHAYFKYFSKVLNVFFFSCRSRRHSENYRFFHFFLSISAFCAKSVGGCCCYYCCLCILIRVFHRNAKSLMNSIHAVVV